MLKPRITPKRRRLTNGVSARIGKGIFIFFVAAIKTGKIFLYEQSERSKSTEINVFFDANLVGGAPHARLIGRDQNGDRVVGIPDGWRVYGRGRFERVNQCRGRLRRKVNRFLQAILIQE